MVTRTVEEDSLWHALEVGDDLEPLESLLAPGTSQQCYHGALLGGEDLDLLLRANAIDTGWLTDGPAAGGEDLLTARGPCQPSTVQASPPSNLPTSMHPGQPLVPAISGIAVPVGALSWAYSDLAGGAGLVMATLEGGGQGLLGETCFAPLQSTHGILQQRHQQQQRQQERQQQQQHHDHPRQLQAGAIPGQPKRRGRPPADRSQMTERQLKAISTTKAHLDRKKNHLCDLEERMADVRVELEREKAQQENNVQAIAAVEKLLHYTEDMVAILTQGQGTSAPGLLHSLFDAPVEPAVASGSSSSSSFAATCDRSETRPLLASVSATQEQQEPEQLDRPLEAAARIVHASSYHSSQGVPRSLALELTPKCRQLGVVWAHRLPATWRFVEALVCGQLPKLHAHGRGAAAAAGTQAASIQLHFRQWRQQREKLEQMPCSVACQPMLEALDMWGVCAAASPDVVAELRSVNPGDIVQGWKDVSRRSRDAMAVYDVMKNESWAVSWLGPMHQLGIAIVMKLATIHNPACMMSLILASADNLSEEQQREKYDALVAALDVTHSQQERYLELADAYAAFVQRARQHKAEALARIGQSAFSSMPATASAGRMVSGYLEALEGASALAAYPDAELVAAVELFSGIAMITKPLQKVKAAAMAYPDFVDLVQMLEAIKRLPPPKQRRQQRGDTKERETCCERAG